MPRVDLRDLIIAMVAAVAALHVALAWRHRPILRCCAVGAA